MQSPDGSFPSRYRTAQGIEGEFQAGSRRRVLANKLGIRSKRVIDQLEFENLLLAQEKYLAIITTETIFTVNVIRLMHREWLGKIYPWAGDFRTVELSKGKFTWPPARLVAQNMATVEKQTLRRWTPCRPGPAEVLANSLAHVQADLLLVHPFREGNGRIARWVTDLMAMQAGRPALDYAFRGRGALRRRNEYMAAVVEGYAENYARLTRLLCDAINRAEGRSER